MDAAVIAAARLFFLFIILSIVPITFLIFARVCKTPFGASGLGIRALLY